MEVPRVKLIHIDDGIIRIELPILKRSNTSIASVFPINSSQYHMFDSTWFFQVHWKQQSCTMESEPCMYMRLMEGTKRKCNIEYEMGIKYADGRELLLPKTGDGYDLTPLREIMRSIDVGNKNCVVHPSTIVFCIVRRVDKPVPEVSSSNPCTSGVTILTGDLKDLYREKRFADVTIKVKNKEFSAHRIILGARSPVFASMFEHNMVEKKSGIVEISDCDPDSFEDFLVYLYTGKINIMSPNNALKLYETADKYDIQDLKENCVRSMTKQCLSVESFCDILRFATMYSENDLLAKAAEFFINNVTAILRTENWQNFLDENSKLCNELYMKFASRVLNGDSSKRKRVESCDNSFSDGTNLHIIHKQQPSAPFTMRQPSQIEYYRNYMNRM